jgi:beta-glucanase (GH16 family)
LAALVAATFAAPAWAQNWQMVWSDEFNDAQGTLPDQTKWVYDSPGAGSSNNEQETYCGLGIGGTTGICANWQQNAQMDGQGHLVIAAINSGTPITPVWTSARLLTQGKFSFSYGRAEASIKLPTGQGVWPAFWAMGTNITQVGWPTCGEIDVMENVLNALGPTRSQSTIHGPGYSGANGIAHAYNFPSGERIDTGYHIYGMIWSQNLIQFYVDDYTQPFASVHSTDIPTGTTWVYNNQPFFMLLNLAMGGGWPGRTDATTPNPALMLVDYVRVYAATTVAPSLSIAKTHSGTFTQGQTGATYTVTVSDAAVSAVTSGAVTVTETVPAGLTLTSMAGTGWTCASNTCTRSDALNSGLSYPPITVTVDVAADAASQVTNQVSVSGGGSAAANASDVTTIGAGALTAPALSSPANGAGNITVTPTLTWSAASGATSYDVYLGTASSPPMVANTTATTYASPALASGTVYYWQIVARSSGGTAASATWSFTTGAPAGALRFVPVTPCRVVDTRNPAGPFGGPTMADQSTRSFAVPQSGCGIPVTAQAYSLNVTVVPEGPLSYLTLWPTGQPQAFVSTLNSFAGNVVANAAIVPAGSGGAVSVFVTNATEVILDINGYFDSPGSPATSYSFYPATPCRVADTRGPAGQFGGPTVGGGQSRDFPVPLSPCNIPATARAFSLNATVVPAGYLGYLTMWPTGLAQPLVSTLNSWKGKIVANAALVPGGSNESISVFVSDPTDVVLDINGYFGQPGSQGALYFYPVTPCRVADTRDANGPFGGPEMAAGATRSFAIPASACGIPATAAAYSMNFTVVPDSRLSYLTAWPTGASQPLVSTLNSLDGSVVANAAIVPAGTSGAVSLFVTDQTHVILDINGYFAP